MNLQALFYILFMGTLWGGSTIGGRFMLGMVLPYTYTGIRFSLAALFYLLASGLRIKGTSFPKGAKLWGIGSLYGILGDAVPTLLFVFSLQYQSSGISAILASIISGNDHVVCAFFPAGGTSETSVKYQGR